MKKYVLVFSVFAFSLFPLAAEAQRGGGPRGPTPVFVTSVQMDEIADRVEALGTLKANESIVLTATVSDTVTAVNFDDGQRVEQGDVLVEMTSDEESALLEEARSTVEEARRQTERLQPLIKQGAASQSTLDEKQRDYETALARLNATQSRMQDRLIRAPFAGVVGLRNISAGALVQPGTKITTLDDDSVMKLDFSVPSLFIPGLQPGLPIVAKSRAFGEREFLGSVKSIDSQIDPVTRSVVVRALLPNDEKLLKPGLLMSVELLKNQRQALVIPEEALISEGTKNFVFVVADRDGKTVAEKREIKTGARQVGDVEVLDGLRAGEKIVTHGTLKLNDGAEVVIHATEQNSESLQELLEQKKSSETADE